MSQSHSGRSLLARRALLSLVLVLVVACSGRAPALVAEVRSASEDPAVEFARIDAHALSTPAAVEGSVVTLAEYLAREARSEREKARAIYRWITANVEYDVQSFFSGSGRWQSGDDVLRSRLAICDGYATLFAALAAEMDLRAVMVRGYAKGYGYDGRRFRGPNHVWNAVEVDGRWELLDATWGAGTMGARSWERDFQEHFFLTPPRAMIYTHLPQQRRWQLLSSPRSMRAFRRQPEVPPHLFSLGFSGPQIEEALRRGVREMPAAYRHPKREIRIEAAPVARTLPAGEEMSIRVRIPEAAGVFLTDGVRWHSLDNGVEPGLWKKSVSLERGRWMVYAEFPGGDDLVFLEYEVM